MTKFTVSMVIVLLSLLGAPSAYTQEVNDEAIVMRVANAIEKNPDLDSALINVVSINGYVLLTGQALNAEQKQQASVAVAFATNDMRRLINEIEVTDSIDNSFAESDAELLTRIQERTANVAVNSEIIVYNAVVHLLGQVSRNEGDAVAGEVSRVPGVKTIRLSYEFQ